MRVAVLLSAAALCLVALAACGGPPPAQELERKLDTPQIYRVSTESQSRLSGAVSGLSQKSRLVTVLAVGPASEREAEVEIRYLAASLEEAGEPVGLSLPDMTGAHATVELDEAGRISDIEEDERLDRARVPGISTEHVIASVLSPLPQESLTEGDTWTGDTPPPFGQFSGPPVRMRYLVDGVDKQAGAASIEGYELSVGPREFASTTPTGEVSGEGDLQATFQGKYTDGGYESLRESFTFDSSYIELSSGDYANGRVRLSYESTVERLNQAEQFALGP